MLVNTDSNTELEKFVPTTIGIHPYVIGKEQKYIKSKNKLRLTITHMMKASGDAVKIKMHLCLLLLRLGELKFLDRNRPPARPSDRQRKPAVQYFLEQITKFVLAKNRAGAIYDCYSFLEHLYGLELDEDAQVLLYTQNKSIGNARISKSKLKELLKVFQC
mmetsp:Transcript_28387/g.41777  ORF Transcript_28387/g.41777 Transcript_28387/m.41777 type:complete len:161 (-) Transcript_28387:14-496(-)